jgi:hypothetical protein
MWQYYGKYNVIIYLMGNEASPAASYGVSKGRGL